MVLAECHRAFFCIHGLREHPFLHRFLENYPQVIDCRSTRHVGGSPVGPLVRAHQLLLSPLPSINCSTKVRLPFSHIFGASLNNMTGWSRMDSFSPTLLAEMFTFPTMLPHSNHSHAHVLVTLGSPNRIRHLLLFLPTLGLVSLAIWIIK